MTDFTTKKFDWRTDTFHPEARRDWARLTDNRTYKGRHNICAEEEPEYRFLGLHWSVFPILSLLAGACWLHTIFGGM